MPPAARGLISFKREVVQFVYNGLTGMLLPTKSQLPCSVYIFTENPLTSLKLSGEPFSWVTVLKRAATGTLLPTSPMKWAMVTSDASSVTYVVRWLSQQYRQLHPLLNWVISQQYSQQQPMLKVLSMQV